LIATVPGSVAGHVADTPFFDVGTVADYMSTSRMFSEEPTADPSTTIHPTARVIRSILWDDVAVSENALVEDCIVTDHVRIPAGREYRRSILFDGPAGITSLSLTVNEHGTPIGSA
jgi:NDP-sugar pyrophosphorylase family protein